MLSNRYQIVGRLGLVGMLLAGAGCSESPALPDEVQNFKISFVGQPNLGTPDQPIPFSTNRNEPDLFVVDIEAMQDGQVDTSYNGWVVISVRPEVVSCGEVMAPDPPAVKLENGVARDAEIRLSKAYCTVRLVATDEGYVRPADMANAACNNGIDDDRDGYIDYPPMGGDFGCFLPSDDSETGGTGAAGASPPIHFRCPLIRDIQTPVFGVTGEESPLKGCRAMVNRGWMLVTRVGVDGLYVTDYEGVNWDATSQNWSFAPDELSYDSMFVYNYSTPLNLQAGDCLTQLDGTVEEFYGYSEEGKPTWKKGDFGFCGVKANMAGLDICPAKETADVSCESGQACPADFRCESGQCRADPESPKGKQCRQLIEQLVNSPVDITTLVISDQGVDRSVWDQTYLMTERFEAGLVKLSNVKMFTEARHCDADHDNAIDFSIDEEKQCSNSCGDDKQCMVWETYNRYNQWSVHFEDGMGIEREVSIVTAGSIQDFDPLAASEAANATGQPRVIKEIIGTLRHLVFGRPPWIIETRWPADCPTCTN